jgi:hypothetical protein
LRSVNHRRQRLHWRPAPKRRVYYNGRCTVCNAGIESQPQRMDAVRGAIHRGHPIAAEIAAHLAMAAVAPTAKALPVSPLTSAATIVLASRAAAPL